MQRDREKRKKREEREEREEREDVEFEALGVPHPSPHRKRFPMWLLVVPLFVPPLLWLARLSFSYSMIATTCRPGMAGPIPPFESTGWIAALAVNIISILIMIALAVMARRIWKHGSGEHDHARGLLLDIGEGRTSFMAHWGVFVSYGFLVVTVFDSIAMFFLPLCGT